MKIYLDFDGTVVEHQWPEMGRCNFGCFEVIKKLQDAGHEIILNTYRADIGDGTLDKAIKLLNEHSFMFFKDRETSINPILEHTKNKINPSAWNWNNHNKENVMFIDDIALDIPLKKACMTNGFMVDWDILDKQFIEHGLYN